MLFSSQLAVPFDTCFGVSFQIVAPRCDRLKEIIMFSHLLGGAHKRLIRHLRPTSNKKNLPYPLRSVERNCCFCIVTHPSVVVICRDRSAFACTAGDQLMLLSGCNPNEIDPAKGSSLQDRFLFAEIST